MNDHRMITKRTGSILAGVLACMIIVTAILFAMLQASLRQRRETHNQWRLRQVSFLLSAGVQRAIEQANSDRLKNETWKPILDLPYQDIAQVEIQAKPASESKKRLIVVTARIMNAEKQAIDSVQRSHSFLLDVEDSTENLP